MTGDGKKHVVERGPVEREVLSGDAGGVEPAHSLDQRSGSVTADCDLDPSGVRLDGRGGVGQPGDGVYRVIDFALGREP